MIHNDHVELYLNLWKTGQIQLNKEREDLLDWLNKEIFTRDDLYFNEKNIENFIAFTERWHFPLQPFQRFIAAMVFLYRKEDDEPQFKEVFITLGRGGGKNGLISALVHFLISPLHDVRRYHTSVVANSEEQAMTSFDDVFNCIKDNRLEKQFENQRSKITGKLTQSVFKFKTSNANTKDGGREACLVFDEIHQYKNQKIVDVLTSGLGKVPNSRIFYIGTDGYERDGFLDSLKERSELMLGGQSNDDRLFPFICKLDTKEEVENPDLWEKANPMLCEPRSTYAKGLYAEVKRQYDNLEHNPSGREEFMTKRMNIPVVDLEKSVATIEELKATKKQIPLLDHKECIGGLDYATLRDFASVGLLFRENGEYIWVNHSFVRKEFVDKFYSYSKGDADNKQRFAPIREWEEKGFLTVVDEPTISPIHIAKWFEKMSSHYGVIKVIADNFRMDLIRPVFDEYGIEYEIIKNPRAVHGLLAPRITDAFANHKINFGDNDMMRWYTQNVLVNTARGSVVYDKKENVRRKTDGFQAFVHAMYRADDVTEFDIEEGLDFLLGLKF